jgi:hypothetical protein
MIFLQNLCNTLGINEWFRNQDGKHETIEDFVNAFSKEADYKGKFLEFCVAGKEYESKSGYTNYDMWLPKSENKKYAMAEVEAGKVMTYEEAKHLKKLEVKDVKGFGDDDTLFNPGKTSSDFTLD